MRFQTSDPDIATLMRRVKRNNIDLQPDFQRGEVWTTVKKQRLVDSILRSWHVPPIHLVAKGEGKFDVLDGQQRLTAIRDFMASKFAVDGSIEPANNNTTPLDGLLWSDLPESIQDQFESFPIRVFELHDYTSEEPYELFFRLNQPTNLTEAEKRNAFIGGPRNQVKDLVEWAKKEGMAADRLGFSNARMAYDDLLARFLLTIEQESLVDKVTAARITSRYRTSTPFDPSVITAAEKALKFFLSLDILDKSKYQEAKPKPNKATIHTWLCMAATIFRAGKLAEVSDILSDTIEFIELNRSSRSANSNKAAAPLLVFNDRATSRVADVSSVVLRDLTAWMLLQQRLEEEDSQGLRPATLAVDAWRALSAGAKEPERALNEFSLRQNWGEAPWV